MQYAKVIKIVPVLNDEVYKDPFGKSGAHACPMGKKMHEDWLWELR